MSRFTISSRDLLLDITVIVVSIIVVLTFFPQGVIGLVVLIGYIAGRAQHYRSRKAR
jgi:hypothetical protein